MQTWFAIRYGSLLSRRRFALRPSFQDDIEIVFGTVSNPTSAQSSVITEIQARYKAFMYTGNPNPTTGGYATWTPAGDSTVSALLFGATGTAAVGACSPDFWGSQVQYDYQIWHD